MPTVTKATADTLVKPRPRLQRPDYLAAVRERGRPGLAGTMKHTQDLIKRRAQA